MFWEMLPAFCSTVVALARALGARYVHTDLFVHGMTMDNPPRVIFPRDFASEMGVSLQKMKRYTPASFSSSPWESWSAPKFAENLT